MTAPTNPFAAPPVATRLSVNEEQVEYGFIGKLQKGLKYEFRPDIRDRASLEKNFREKFEALNRVKLTESEFARLLDEIVTPDVYAAAKTLRSINAFTRDDGTPLNYTLVNIKDWCKNTFEVIHQLRINTDNSHHRYDVLILINGVPCVQIELKTLGVNPRRAMEQIVEYKHDAGNGYTKTLLCFMQLFIVSNRDRTFDECHRSQFGDNHKAIKAFFPKAQLFGFTGTPIFKDNATVARIESKAGADDAEKTLVTTQDLFQQQLHAYTITHAIEDGNVLRFHIDYFKPKAKTEKAAQPTEKGAPKGLEPKPPF
jgi:type I site-specific restriction-modification system R (restriction) subunit